MRRSSTIRDRRKALLDRRCSSSRCADGASGSAALADVIVTPSAAILPPGTPAIAIRVLEWGADTDRFHARRAGPAPFVRPPAPTVAVFAGAFRALARRDPPGRRDRDAARARTPRHRRGADRRRPGAAARARRGGAAARRTSSSRARCRTTRCPRPGRGRHRRRAVRPVRARAAGARLLLVAAEDLRVHGGRAAGRRARDRRMPRSSRTDAKGSSTIRARPGALADALVALTDRAAARAARSGGARAGRARLQLGGALPGARARRSRDANACAARPRDEDPDRHRRVPAGLRRQRLEHLRARARAARARARRPRSCSRGPGAPAGVRETELRRLPRAASSAPPRPTSRTCATTSRTSG